MATAMSMTGPVGAFAADEASLSGIENVTQIEPTDIPAEQEVSQEPSETPAPDDTPVVPSESPEPSENPEPGDSPEPGENPEPSETPDPSETPEPSVTPEPDDTPVPSVTPDPGETPEPSETPDPSVSPSVTPALSAESQEKVAGLIKEIDAAYAMELNDTKKNKVKELRKTYDSLTDTEKAAVTNYDLLTDMEKIISQTSEAADDSSVGFTDGTGIQALYGTPVYYASNLHAGKEFYLNSLQENYQLSFSDDFADIMDQIESEYKQQNQLTDVSDTTGGITTSADALLVRNWQDILAVYVYEQSLKGVTSYTLDASCKDDLAAIFAQMNPVIRDEKDSGKVTYGNYHINYYIKKNKIPKSERGVLKKYLGNRL